MAQVFAASTGGRNALIVSLGEPIPIKNRIRHEIDLVKQQWHLFILSAFILFYGSVVVFRNLAFYRFKATGNRLKDLGHEIIPEVDGFKSAPTNMLLFMEFIVTIALFNCFRGNHANWQKPYATNLMVRLLLIVSFGHILRFFAFISTTVPGSADYCIVSNSTGSDIIPEQPKTILECFTKVRWDMDENCGDLMFSGHMLQAVTLGMFLQTYSRDIFALDWLRVRIFVWLMWVYVAAQAVMIVSLRHHYTSDVVVASFVAPLLWYAYDHKYRQTDPVPRNLEVQLSEMHIDNFDDDSFAYQQLHGNARNEL